MDPRSLRCFSVLTSVLTLLMLILPAGGYVWAQDSGPPKNAHGALEVAGKSTPLEFSYAVPQRNDEMLVILSDQPLADKELKDVFERIHRTEGGELHLVEVVLDAKPIPISVSIRDKEFTAHGCFGTTRSRASATGDRSTAAANNA